MSRRTAAALVALLMLVGLGVLANRRPVGYTLFSPGPTLNVLGKAQGHAILDISGHRTYRDDGQLRLLTIVLTPPDEKVGLVRALAGWVSPDVAVYPHDAVYQPDETGATVKQQSAQEMTSSQDNAIAAALRELHIRFTRSVKIAQVLKGGPAEGKLEADDVILSVDGTAVPQPEDVQRAVRTRPIGSTVDLKVRREGSVKDVRMKTVAAGTTGPSATQSAVKVQIEPGYDFPFPVHVQLSDNIGGPSAGLMFAMGIYDLLTPGSLTGGRVIAGTGEIDGQGKVSPIGGIQQKMVGAQHDGARLFLAPAANCAEALGGHYDPHRMRLVKVTTLASALSSVKAWTQNPDADLPKCTR